MVCWFLIYKLDCVTRGRMLQRLPRAVLWNADRQTRSTWRMK